MSAASSLDCKRSFAHTAVDSIGDNCGRTAGAKNCWIPGGSWRQMWCGRSQLYAIEIHIEPLWLKGGAGRRLLSSMSNILRSTVEALEIHGRATPCRSVEDCRLSRGTREKCHRPVGGIAWDSHASVVECVDLLQLITSSPPVSECEFYTEFEMCECGRSSPWWEDESHGVLHKSAGY